MTLSMYQATVPVFVRMLGNLSTIVDKGAAFAEARQIDPGVLIAGRLAPDMLPLARQVYIATDGAKGCVARLAGVDVPSYPDIETTFVELKERIAKTIAYIETFTPDQIDGSEDRIITLKLRGADMSLQGQVYLLNFVLPNLYFHITVAHAILRHNGVSLGKIDYLGAVPQPPQ